MRYNDDESIKTKLIEVALKEWGTQTRSFDFPEFGEKVIFPNLAFTGHIFGILNGFKIEKAAIENIPEWEDKKDSSHQGRLISFNEGLVRITYDIFKGTNGGGTRFCKVRYTMGGDLENRNVKMIAVLKYTELYGLDKGKFEKREVRSDGERYWFVVDPLPLKIR